MAVWTHLSRVMFSHSLCLNSQVWAHTEAEAPSAVRTLRCASSNQHVVLSVEGTVREERSGCYVMQVEFADKHVEVIFQI